MNNQFELRTEQMPIEMRALLEDYPRESWEAHPGFHEKTRNWLGAHQMFRQLGELVRIDAELYLDKGRSQEDYEARLSRFGSMLVGNLIGHHGWEDREYFPELSAADPRFDQGLEILEHDHHELDQVLEAFTQTGNRALSLLRLDPEQARDEIGQLHEVSQTIETFLNRHLGDEEDLAVPIILHHRLRG